MARTITLQDIKIKGVSMRQIQGEWVLEASFVYLDDQGDEVQGDQAVRFWQEIPEVKDPDLGVLPTPDNWYELTAAEVTYLTTLLVNVKARVGARVL